MSSASDEDKEITETIMDPVKTLNRCWDMAKSAREEILVMLSTSNAFIRQENLASIELLKELSLKKKDLKIRFLVPKRERAERVRSELKKCNINLNYIQEFSQTKISVLIVDRRCSMVVELNKDVIDPMEAIGYSTYSTRIMTVLSYVSIFESYWTLSQLYEESTNELAYAKEYLNKVLNELETQKKIKNREIKIKSLESSSRYRSDASSRFKGNYLPNCSRTF